MLKKTVASMVAVSIALAGCATASKDIPIAYVSPLQFQSYDCEQLSAEAARIQARVGQLGGRLDEAASNDQGIMAVGLILFWPALFFLGGTKQQEAEYGRLKGEYEALQKAAVERKCTAACTAASARESASYASHDRNPRGKHQLRASPEDTPRPERATPPLAELRSPRFSFHVR